MDLLDFHTDFQCRIKGENTFTSLHFPDERSRRKYLEVVLSRMHWPPAFTCIQNTAEYHDARFSPDLRCVLVWLSFVIVTVVPAPESSCGSLCCPDVPNLHNFIILSPIQPRLRFSSQLESALKAILLH